MCCRSQMSHSYRKSSVSLHCKEKGCNGFNIPGDLWGLLYPSSLGQAKPKISILRRFLKKCLIVFFYAVFLKRMSVLLFLTHLHSWQLSVEELPGRPLIQKARYNIIKFEYGFIIYSLFVPIIFCPYSNFVYVPSMFWFRSASFLLCSIYVLFMFRQCSGYNPQRDGIKPALLGCFDPSLLCVSILIIKILKNKNKN